jgi:hypothetical protein
MLFLTYPHKRGREIRISDFCFIRLGPNWLNYFLETSPADSYYTIMCPLCGKNSINTLLGPSSKPYKRCHKLRKRNGIKSPKTLLRLFQKKLSELITGGISTHRSPTSASLRWSSHFCMCPSFNRTAQKSTQLGLIRISYVRMNNFNFLRLHVYNFHAHEKLAYNWYTNADPFRSKRN